MGDPLLTLFPQFFFQMAGFCDTATVDNTLSMKGCCKLRSTQTARAQLHSQAIVFYYELMQLITEKYLVSISHLGPILLYTGREIVSVRA